MSEQATLPVRRPRLNPFVFPSDTKLRFVLLVIFVVCGIGQLWGELYGPTDPAANECASRVWSEMSKLLTSPSPPSPANVDLLLATISRDYLPMVARCAALVRPVVVWQIGGMCLVVMVAALLYYLYPTWKLTTGRLERIRSSELPEIQDELHCIAETARLTVPPVFVWNPLAAGLPIAFGHHGRYYVALSGSFIAQYFYRDKSAFRAVLLHELAHIRNGDVHKTYLTMSLWLAFVATALVPSLLISFWRLTTLHWFDAAPLILVGSLWTGVIILSGLAVLRVREYYADVQASVWDQTSQIDRVLAVLSKPVGEGWRRYFRFHPDPGERRQTLEDPSRLFGLSFADVFGIGIAAWAVVDVVTTIVFPFVPEQGWAVLVFASSIKVIVPAVVFVFAIGAIGIGVWRSAFASLLKGDRPSKRTGRLAAAFVAGAFPGLIVYLAQIGLQSLKGLPIPFWYFLTNLQLYAVTYLVLLVGCWLVFRWISEVALAWFEVVLQSRSPRPILLVSVATAQILVLATVALASFVVMFSFLPARWGSGPSGIYRYGLAPGVPVLIVSLIVWAFPLAASWWRRASVSTGLAPWVFLDGASPEISSQKPLRPGEGLLAGVVMGLVFCLLWELCHFRNHFPAVISVGIDSAFGWIFTWMTREFGDRSFVLSGSDVVFQALAAAIAAGSARRLSVVCGLFAAFVTGCIIIVSDVVFFGIGHELWASRQALAYLAIMGLGAIVALPTAIMGAWIGMVARRVFPDSVVSQRFGHPVEISSDSPSMIAGPSSEARVGADRRNKQRRHGRWSPFLKGCVATLCIVVSIGMAARIREQVLAKQDVSAYRTSAGRGDRDAQAWLGSMYASGQSVARDDAQAVFWWRKAAEQGHADAQYNLARMSFTGRGVAQDDTMAFQWFRKAAEQGHADAENRLGLLYAWGRGVTQDDSQAMQWFRQAAQRGNSAAQYNLGTFYALGRGMPRDDIAAVEWLRKSAEQGYADAENSLGSMYRQGRSLPKDDPLALHWFRSAAEQGHAGAQFNVAQMYEKGEAVAKDDEQAIHWYRKAAVSGHPDARNRLQTLCDNGLRNACTR